MRKKYLLPRLTSLLLVACCSTVLAQHVPASQEVVARAKLARPERIKLALDRLHGERSKNGLDERAGFSEINSDTDQFGHTHTRFQQSHNGVKVWGGEIITHMDENATDLPHTNLLKANIEIDTRPRLPQAVAEAHALKIMALHKPKAATPETELVIYPVTQRVLRGHGVNADRVDATMLRDSVQRYVLAYHIHIETNDRDNGLRSQDFIVDADSGGIFENWDSLQTAAATGFGLSQYSGIVAMSTNSLVGGGYEIRDMTRGVRSASAILSKQGLNPPNNLVLNYNSFYPFGTVSSIFVGPDNYWGDGRNFDPVVSGTQATVETAAADVSFGIASAWDFYKNVFNRNGFDGNKTPTYAIVNADLSYFRSQNNNAAWISSCFCMVYGLGVPSKSINSYTTLDISGHELTHGVTSNSARLVSSRESGGLSEATSDIFATMIEFYARGANGTGSVIPDSGSNANWTIGEGVLPGSEVIRNMAAPVVPSWTLSLGDLDIHTSAGPMNRAFYMMSKGDAANGVAKITNDRAAKIWYRALTTYLGSTANYVAARQAAVTAARDLYGPASPEEKTVWNAFHAINVGDAWSEITCGNLGSGRELFAGESVYSCNGQYYLTMQGDGNLVLYKHPITPVWNSMTYGNPGAYAVMQADGNLVVYAPASTNTDETINKPLWSAMTFNSPGAKATISGDGNMVINSPNGLPVWYVTQPAGTAPMFNASRANISIAAADTVAPTYGAIAGVMTPDDPPLFPPTSQFFKLTLPPGKSVTLDFLGSMFGNNTNNWTLNMYVWDGSKYAAINVPTVSNPAFPKCTRPNVSCYDNTRITQTFANPSSGTSTAYVEVLRGDLDAAVTFPVSYTMAVKYN